MAALGAFFGQPTQRDPDCAAIDGTGRTQASLAGTPVPGSQSALPALPAAWGSAPDWDMAPSMATQTQGAVKPKWADASSGGAAPFSAAASEDFGCSGFKEFSDEMASQPFMLKEPTKDVSPHSKRKWAFSTVATAAGIRRMNAMRVRAIALKRKKLDGAEKAALVPEEEVMAQHVSELLSGRDLQAVSLGVVRGELEDRLTLPRGTLDASRDHVNGIIKAEVTRIQTGKAGGPQTPEKRKPRRRRRVTSATRRRIFARATASSSDEEQARAHGNAGSAGQSVPLEPPTEREAFLSKAKPLQIKVGGEMFELSAKSFKSGGCGFYTLEKTHVEVNGVSREAMVQVNVAILGSKEWTDSTA